VEEVERSFSNASLSYKKVATVQRLIGERLLERLDYFKIEPRCILDLGAGSGIFSYALKKRFPRASIISLDLSLHMLKAMKQRFRKKPARIVADMLCLPFLDKSVDMVFANQSLHWGRGMPAVLKEIERILKKEGLLLFTTLGPDTFQEIKHAWQGLDNHEHVNDFHDMHDIGDMLLHAGMRDPVMDMDYMTARYDSFSSLCRDLKSQGVKNIHLKRRTGLVTKKKWQEVTQKYEKFRDDQGYLPLSYEVLYGQAWGGMLKNKSDEVCVPITSLTLAKKNNVMKKF
jgi:malonyl-CoA O-methyltransferase